MSAPATMLLLVPADPRRSMLPTLGALGLAAVLALTATGPVAAPDVSAEPSAWPPAGLETEPRPSPTQATPTATASR